MVRVRQARRCTARRRQGPPCRCCAVVGGYVRRVHGGAASQVRATANRRVVQARAVVISAIARRWRTKALTRGGVAGNNLRGGRCSSAPMCGEGGSSYLTIEAMDVPPLRCGHRSASGIRADLGSRPCEVTEETGAPLPAARAGARAGEAVCRSSRRTSFGEPPSPLLS